MAPEFAIIIASILVAGIVFLFFYRVITKKKKSEKASDKKKNVLSAIWLSEELFEKRVLVPKKRKVVSWTVANKYQIIAEDKRVIEKRLNTDAYSQKKGGSVLLFGGAGSGKSANIILPTIYRSLENDVKPSLIVTDPKGELHSDTYKFAEKNGYLVINFSKTGDTWNPLTNIWEIYHTRYDKTKIDDEINIITEILVNKPVDAGANSYFFDKAKDIVKGWIWMFLELDTSKAAYTLHNVAKYARQFTTEGYKKMLDSLKPESVSKIYLTEVLSGKDGGLTSAISTAHNALKMFLSESIAHLTSKATFSMEELITKPTILYIRFGEYKEVATLLMALCYKNLNSYLEDNHVFSFERPIHYIVDEFGNLPKMEFVSKIFSLDRSKNIFALLTLQSKSQLLAIYGRERTQELIDSAQATIICSLSDIEFAGELSRKAGMSLRKTTSTSEGKDKDSGSKTTQEQAFKNVEESDFINKESDEMIVVLSGERPYKFKFIPFWKQDYYKEVVEPCK